MLKSSAKRGASDLIARAVQLAAHPFFAGEEVNDNEQDSSTSRRVLPIYQSYLADRLGVVIPSPDDEKWRRRAQDSAEFRKRLVAAFLSICNEFDMEVRYASAEVILQLSDKCTRDFLAQVETIYRSVAKPLTNFLEEQIPYGDQTGPIRLASEEKSKSLVKFGVRTPSDTGRLIDGLARITAILQTTSTNSQHLRSSERGIFELDILEGKTRRFSSYQKLIVDASEAGFLRLFTPDGKALRFRVHTSLAAAYGFSYRGAYYTTRLAWSDIARIIEAETEDSHDRAIRETGRRLAGQESDDQPMFDFAQLE